MQHPEHAQPGRIRRQNPMPLCSSIEFSGPALPYVREQLKLETTRIRVVARTSDGKSHVAFREVKVTTRRLRRLIMGDQIKIRAQIQGEITEVRILMQHPMETGQRKDDKGQTLRLNSSRASR